MSLHHGKPLCVSSIFRPGLYDGQVAIVTGGATGIGKGITKELLFLGCTVVIASRKADRLADGAEEIRNWLQNTGRQASLHVLQCNVRKEDEVKNLISTTVRMFGKLDFLVNNGGGQFLSSTADIRLKGWNAVVETNLTGTFLLCREAYNQWMKDHGGVIVNMAMDMWKGYPFMGHSGAARAGVVNLTKTLGVEWAQSNVRVNAVAPGSSIASPTAAANYGNANIFDAAAVNIPLKRTGTVEEVSSAVCFLLSPGAAFITGETIRIDGGQSFYITPNFRLSEDSKPSDVYRWQSQFDSDHPTGTKSKL
ncbi:peroxisomal trans-2-enoyl-CoA reductase-like [Elysia marginata]|uniref:Peroxisomal trans-2-enoyl-CoA reductase n=1 Tax=Elysia marginata TaxID=1093978 RepID=A0AAV4IY65_9GAST|nr:peroxisomal trans-2-enoyl-CoA reductase-like [Elysia marginata]